MSACGGDEGDDGAAAGASTGGTSGGGGSGSGASGAGSGGGASGGVSGAGGGGAAGASGGAGPGGGGEGGSANGGSANGASGGEGSGGGPLGVGCPANAFFCADFETNDLPNGAVYVSDSTSTNWLDDFEIDDSMAAVGTGSLKVRSNTEAESGGIHQMLAVPSGGDTFWIRFHIRSDQILGQDGRNTFVVASAGNGTNDEPALELSEDCGIALISNDSVLRTDGSTEVFPCMTPMRLSPDSWHCIELSINGSSGDTQLYVDGEHNVDARGWPPAKGAFRYVKFGVINLHPVARTIWYDEFGVAPSRLGCPAASR